MNSQQILEELIELLEKTDIEIRREPLDGGGGLCRMKGRTILFLDTHSTSTQNAVLCAEALVKTIDVETIYMKPEIRQFIENNMGKDNHL